MASLPKRVCACGAAVHGKCTACDAKRRKLSDRAHPRAGAKWYNTRRWREERGAFLFEQRNWFCYNPLGLHHAGHRVRSETVDHVIPHKGDERLFWSHDNWAGCCLRCNSAKAAKEEGGFGNAVSY